LFAKLAGRGGAGAGRQGSALDQLLRKWPGLHRIFADDPKLLLQLGARMFDQGERAGAELVLGRAVELGAPAWQAAVIRAKRAMMDGANAQGLSIIEPFLGPDANTELDLLAGTCAWNDGKIRVAIAHYEAGIAKAPRDPELLGSLCGAYGVVGEYRKSHECAQRALRYDPRHAVALQNLGIACRELFLLPEQREAHARLCDYYPDSERFRCLYSFAVLMEEDFAAGWPLHESRDFRFREQNFRESTLASPRWNGEPFEGKTLLVVCEQGSGDNFMVARWFPEIKRRGGRVVVECAPYLMAILARVPGVDQVIQLENTKEPDLHYDLWIGSMSLPHIFKVTRENIHAPARYLEPGEGASTYWRERAKQMKELKVGLAWAGNAGHASDLSRSMRFADIDPLFDLPGVKFFNLQVPARDLLPRASLFNYTDELVTFDDTAGLIDQMDLVISVDTSIAHLAAALGKPTWVVTAFRPEWRWGRIDLPVMWYPTAKLYRCETPLNWKSAIRRVFEDLRALAAARSGTATGKAAHAA